MIKESTYTDHVLRALDTGNFFHFRRDYVRWGVLTKLEALFLQDLINRAAMKKVKKDPKGYFRCSIRDLWNTLCWERDTQKRYLKLLKDKGYVKVKVKISGSVRRRYVRIIVKKIEADLDAAETGGGKNPPGKSKGVKTPPARVEKPPRQEGVKTPLTKVTRKKVTEKGSNPRSQANGHHSLLTEPICRKLYDKLVAEGKIISSTLPLSQWPKMASKFVNKLPGGLERFSRVVQGYINRFGEPFMPEAYSMRSLVDNQGDKFIRIERHLNRPDWTQRKDPNRLRDDEQP